MNQKELEEILAQKTELRTEQFADLLLKHGTITTGQGANFNHRFGHHKHVLVKKGWIIEVKRFIDEANNIYYKYTYKGKKKNFVYKNAKEKMSECIQQSKPIILNSFEDLEPILKKAKVHLVSSGK